MITDGALPWGDVLAICAELGGIVEPMLWTGEMIARVMRSIQQFIPRFW